MICPYVFCCHLLKNSVQLKNTVVNLKIFSKQLFYFHILTLNLPFSMEIAIHFFTIYKSRLFRKNKLKKMPSKLVIRLIKVCSLNGFYYFLTTINIQLIITYFNHLIICFKIRLW